MFAKIAGPFTYDDSFIVSPFKDSFEYIKDVPYKYASKILALLNAGPHQKRDNVDRHVHARTADACPLDDMSSLTQRAAGMPMKKRIITKRQEVVVPGYTTTDDFGTDGMYKLISKRAFIR